MQFDWQGQRVQIDYLKNVIQLTIAQCRLWLATIDTACNTIYPIGTLVELDLDYVQPELRASFEDANLGLFLVIQSRLLPTKQTDYYLNYLATMWPMGISPDVHPITLNNYQVKRVVHMGFTNDLDEQYVLKLRQEFLTQKRIPTSYSAQTSIPNGQEVVTGES
ncbi:DUF4176 domain-containing protein [Latilactobacillus fragifolii]|uniref:DUF4176 domain-containing protein n=1 Tax=Latilactobacillus fragifolii TaxID=2814244 RepID=UPI001ABA469D|nr:DUF4176 domain-containing protein [Latilactobacillus fragifolii]